MLSIAAASRDFCIGRLESVHRFTERQDAKRFRAAVRLVKLPKAFADKEPENSTLMLIREGRLRRSFISRKGGALRLAVRSQVILGPFSTLS